MKKKKEEIYRSVPDRIKTGTYYHFIICRYLYRLRTHYFLSILNSLWFLIHLHFSICYATASDMKLKKKINQRRFHISSFLWEIQLCACSWASDSRDFCILLHYYRFAHFCVGTASQWRLEALTLSCSFLHHFATCWHHVSVLTYCIIRIKFFAIRKKL